MSLWDDVSKERISCCKTDQIRCLASSISYCLNIEGILWQEDTGRLIETDVLARQSSKSKSRERVSRSHVSQEDEWSIVEIHAKCMPRQRRDLFNHCSFHFPSLSLPSLIFLFRFNSCSSSLCPGYHFSWHPLSFEDVLWKTMLLCSVAVDADF